MQVERNKYHYLPLNDFCSDSAGNDSLRINHGNKSTSTQKQNTFQPCGAHLHQSAIAIILLAVDQITQLFSGPETTPLTSD